MSILPVKLSDDLRNILNKGRNVPSSGMINERIHKHLKLLEKDVLLQISEQSDAVAFCFEEEPLKVFVADPSLSLEHYTGEGFLNYYWQKRSGCTVAFNGKLYDFTGETRKKISEFCLDHMGFSKNFIQLLNFLEKE